MTQVQVLAKDKAKYNKSVTHIIQSWEWGEFRKKLGLPLIRHSDKKFTTSFQLTLHKIPFTHYYIGYLPKGPFPDKNLADILETIALENNCAAIKIEPNIQTTDYRLQPPLALASRSGSLAFGGTTDIDRRFKKSPKALFTKYNFTLDLTQSEAEILNKMHPKTRYNIKVAQKHKVWVEERIDDEAFNIYLKLYFDTTKRQRYYGHNETYHRLAWETLKKRGMARVLIAFYKPPTTNYKLPLTAWMLLNFHDTLYYPYGGSATEYKNTMSSTLVAWEAIKLGKKMKLKKFDLWGALDPNPDIHHPWYGFHRFKEGLGGELAEYIGTYDIIFNPFIYYLFTFIDQFTPLKVLLLKILKR